LRLELLTSSCFLAHFEREFSGPVEPAGKELDMKKSKYTDEQIAFALKRAETGTPVAKVIRRMGILEQTFYRWKKVYGVLGVGEVRRLKLLEEENRKLKQLVADLSLDKHNLQDILSKKL
jgi:putative transposase